MDNPDVLSHILVTVDDAVLENLSKTPLWSVVKKVLDKPNFWYLRSQVLTKKNIAPRYGADWRRIYRHLQALMNQQLGTVEDLDSAIVITEVFGDAIWSEDKLGFEPWTRITNVDVLKYLLENGYIKRDRYQVLLAISYNAARGLREVVDFLFSLKVATEDMMVTEAIEGAITGDQLELLKYLLGLGIYDYTPSELLEQVSISGGPEIAKHILTYDIDDRSLTRSIHLAADNNKPRVLELIIQKKPDALGPAIGLEKLLRTAASNGSVEVARLLIENTYDSIIPSRELLNLAIGSGSPDMVKYVLTMADPTSRNNEVLIYAMRMRADVDAVQALLEDPRIDPNINLREIIASSSPLDNRSSLEHPSMIYRIRERGGALARIDLVLRDKRIEIEKMDVKTFRLAIWTLGKAIVDPILNGFLYGNSLAEGRILTDIEALTVLEEDLGEANIYSALLRLLFVKRPNAREIFEWLVNTDEPDIVLEAARSVLDKRIRTEENAVPLRELILALIYPSMTLEEVVKVLRSEGRQKMTIITSCRLVGAYIGYRDAKTTQKKR